MERIPKRDFLFIDETGDPGNDFSNGGSNYFALGCFHVTDLSLEQLHRHLFAMGYFSGRFADAIVHIVKEYVFGSRESVDGRLLKCMQVTDVSDPKSPQPLAFAM
ncbi:MAG: DUF3800 domain-containing protein [Patescibacteria group bacterium]